MIKNIINHPSCKGLEGPYKDDGVKNEAVDQGFIMERSSHAALYKPHLLSLTHIFL